MTMYDVKGRGHAKQEPLTVGTNVMRYSQNTDLELKQSFWILQNN